MHEPAHDETIEKERQALLASFPRVPFMKLMGLELLDVAPGSARMCITWRPDLCQPAGILHGGAMASLIDTAIAQAILLTPPCREARQRGGYIVTLDLRIRYLRPVSQGKVYCDAQVVRSGRQIIHAHATATDEDGKQAALAESMYMTVFPENLQKRES
jgi:acyl-CoA thioesterase